MGPLEFPLFFFFGIFFGGAFFNGILGLLESDASLGFLVFSPAKIILFSEMLKFSSNGKGNSKQQNCGKENIKNSRVFLLNTNFKIN